MPYQDSDVTGGKVRLKTSMTVTAVNAIGEGTPSEVIETYWF